MDDEYCPQCGQDAERFEEGVCLDCCQENHDRHMRHTFEHQRWLAMTDVQRENEIKWAAQNPTY